MQMRPFVFPLLSAGYRVIAYDQPAHGVSEGRLTGLPDFSDALAEIAWHHGEVRAVTGHSLWRTPGARWKSTSSS
jgi:alpha-beta hydrolase superfamily lysophospholipase